MDTPTIANFPDGTDHLAEWRRRRAEEEGRRHRPWFECPGVTDGVACGRRAAKLYYRDGLFLCRLCQDLSYASQGRAFRTFSLRKA